MLKENIRKMDHAGSSLGMDIVIVSTSTLEQEYYWQQRLEETKGSILKPHALHIAVHEDWAGGGGNGLGSFYAYQKAREKAYVNYKVDIFQRQREGASVALYHTAGEGKRLYPLIASEYGNKGAIKLPSTIKGHDEPLTLLEAVIKQTSIYAPARKGRFSVFWADQLFIPSNSPDYLPRHHADIFVKLMPMPTEEEWIQKELSRYRMIAINKEGHAQHIDKSDFATIKKLIASGKMSISGGLSMSLGSFSLSSPLTFAFMQEFQPELIQKNIKMDSDPYFWMALSMDQPSYIQAMLKRGVSEEEAKNHHLRLGYFKNHFTSKFPDPGFFGIVDIGQGSFWWDFGSIDSYFNNLLKLTQNTVEGYLLRDFFKLEQNFNTKSKVASSIIVGSHAEKMEVENCIVINSSFKELRASGCLFYNVLEEEDLDKTSIVRADTYLSSESKQIKIYAEREQDNKKIWHTKLPNNSTSFEELSKVLSKEDALMSAAEFQALKEISKQGIISNGV